MTSKNRHTECCWTPVKSDTLEATHSLLVTDQLMDEVRRIYGFAGELHATLLRAWTNDVYQVAACGLTYILKVYRRSWRSSTDVAWETGLQDYLAVSGAPVPAVIPTVEHRLIGSITAPEGIRAIALFECAAGTKPQPPFTERLSFQYGNSAALLHQTSDDFTSSHPRLAVDLDSLIDRPLAAIEPWLRQRPKDWRMVQRIANVARKMITSCIDDDLDWGVCHGDLSLDNVHVTESGQVLFYDFDQSCFGWRAWDICNALSHAPSERQAAFLAGYTRVRPLSESALSSIPFFAAADALRGMESEITDWSQWYGTLRVDDWINDKLAWLRAWEHKNDTISKCT